MHFRPATIIYLLLATNTVVGALTVRNENDDDDNEINIFKESDDLWNGAICKDDITKTKYPGLVLPHNVHGGCVRYYRGIDMTGDLTEIDLYFKPDGIASACDCIAACLKRIDICTNWVFKHTFKPDLDSGKRSCTLYSSPNLPSGVNVTYDLAHSPGSGTVGANPQLGGGAPFTFLDVDNKKKDRFGVSGFIAQDADLKLYC